MKMEKGFKTFYLCLIFSILFLTNSLLAADSPKNVLQKSIDSVIEVLKDQSLAALDKKEVRREKITVLIRERFGFEEMSKRCLAKHWKKRTESEKKEFISIFSDLLIYSYIAKIEGYTNEKVTYDKETIKGKGKYAVVATTIVTDVDILIDYKLKFIDNKWQVYDIIIEGVSFVSNYRNQYNKIILKKSYAELIEKMSKKLQERRTALKKGKSE